jgi:hypothetical protein
MYGSRGSWVSAAKCGFQADALGKVRSVVGGLRPAVDISAPLELGERQIAIENTALIK